MRLHQDLPLAGNDARPKLGMNVISCCQSSILSAGSAVFESSRVFLAQFLPYYITSELLLLFVARADKSSITALCFLHLSGYVVPITARSPSSTPAGTTSLSLDDQTLHSLSRVATEIVGTGGRSTSSSHCHRLRSLHPNSGAKSRLQGSPKWRKAAFTWSEPLGTRDWCSSRDACPTFTAFGSAATTSCTRSACSSSSSRAATQPALARLIRRQQVQLIG